MKNWRRIALAVMSALAVAVAVSGCGGGGGGVAGGGAETTPEVGTSVRTSLFSTKVGAPYILDIYLPPSYATGTATFPTIYALDGDAQFDQVNSRFTNFKKIMQKRGTSAILVAIGGTVRRQTDYNFPGATAYHEFLTKELIPYIDSTYRTNPAKRALSGLSTSGNLPATALFLEAPTTLYFSHFLSTEAAFWQTESQAFPLEQQMFDAIGGKPLPVTLVLARSTGEAQFGGTNAIVVHDMYTRIAARAYPGLTLLETPFPASHVGADNLAFEDALVRFFP